MTARLLPPALAALALAGCLSFGADPPDTLLTLTAAEAPAAGGGGPAALVEAVVVSEPGIPDSLRTNRIPVQSSDTEIAYLKDAQWVSTPDKLFRQLLADVIAARTGRAVLDPLQTTVLPGARLTGRLQAFGLDARTMQATIIYDAVLSRGDAVDTRRFEARVPVSVAETTAVAPALNQAANQVASQVADWIGR